MKTFIAQVSEMINGFETMNIVLISAKNQESAQKKLNNRMKVWREGGGFSDKTGYWFDGGGICVNGYVQKEIPKDHAKILALYI